MPVMQTLLLFSWAITASLLFAAAPVLPPHPLVGQRFVPDDADWQKPVHASIFDDEAALKDWKLEGGKRMSLADERLVLESSADRDAKGGHLVCWLTRELSADFLAEFKMRPGDRKDGLAIVFYNTQGLRGESIFDPALAPRSGDFKRYHSGDLNGYHVSYWAEVRAFFEGRITNWDADEQVKKHQHREIVGASAALAMHDAQSTGRLHPVTRQALDRMWTLQRKDGAWSWPKCSWPPFEVDDYYGAVLAAVGVGHAPENCARSDAAKAGVDKLREYLKKMPAPNLHHRDWLLWAAVRLDGLLGHEEKQSTIRDLLALQREDGGWSMESLVPEWTGREGEKANPEAPSDGYGTGLVVFVLREAGISANHEALQRGVKWLSTNQPESGRWFTRSLNDVPQHFISDTATVFAVLALKACE